MRFKIGGNLEESLNLWEVTMNQWYEENYPKRVQQVSTREGWNPGGNLFKTSESRVIPSLAKRDRHSLKDTVSHKLILARNLSMV